MFVCKLVTHSRFQGLYQVCQGLGIYLLHLTRGKGYVGCSVQIYIQSIYLRQDYELIRNDGNMLSCQGEGVPMKMLRGIVYWQIMCVYLQGSCASATLQVNIWSVTFMQQGLCFALLVIEHSCWWWYKFCKDLHQVSQDIQFILHKKWQYRESCNCRVVVIKPYSKQKWRISIEQL